MTSDMNEPLTEGADPRICFLRGAAFSGYAIKLPIAEQVTAAAFPLNRVVNTGQIDGRAENGRPAVSEQGRQRKDLRERANLHEPPAVTGCGCAGA
jgi:hypothetical protein